MTVQLIYGIMADLTFYITCSSPAALLFMLALDIRMPVYLPAALIFISAALSCILREKGALRFLPLVLLPAAILFSKYLIIMLWMLPAVVYVLVSALKNSYRGLFFEFSMFFRIAAFIVPVIGILVNIQPMAQGWDMGTFVLSVMFLCAGISKIRYMRQSRDNLRRSKAFHISNLAVMLTLVCVTVGITLLINYGFNKIEPPVYEAQGTVQSTEEPIDTETVSPTETPARETLEDNDFVDWEEPVITSGKAFLWLRAVIFAAIFIFLFWIIYKRIKKRTENEPSGDNIKINPIHEQEMQKPPRTRDKSHRDNIRRIYRRYLKLLTSRRITIERYHTSKDVNSLAKKTGETGKTGKTWKNPVQHDELRKLYALARYDREAQITREHVAKMRELFNAVKRGMQ